VSHDHAACNEMSLTVVYDMIWRELISSCCKEARTRYQNIQLVTRVYIQPFSQKSLTPTVAKELQFGLYDAAEADLELFCTSWSEGNFGRTAVWQRHSLQECISNILSAIRRCPWPVIVIARRPFSGSDATCLCARWTGHFGQRMGVL